MYPANPWRMCFMISIVVINSLWSILSGKKIKHGDENMRHMVKGSAEFIESKSLSGMT